MAIGFPYRFRRGQESVVDAVARACDARAPLVLESGTGTGKTVTSLYSVARKMEPGQKLLYLTRTNAQQLQVLTEMARIAPDGKPLVLGIRGRGSLCPMLEKDADLSGGSPDELSRWCAEMKKRSSAGHPGCPFYEGLREVPAPDLVGWARGEKPTVERWKERMLELGVCPYEAAKSALRDAEGAAAPYIFFFNGHIRRNLLDWMGVDVQDLLIVVDEAHNLPEYLRELSSASLSQTTLARASSEAMEYEDPLLDDGMPASRFVSSVGEVVEGLADEFVSEEDGFVPPEQLREDLMARFGVTSIGLRRLALEAVNVGEVVKEERARRGKLPRSYLMAVGGFLDFWEAVEPEQYVKLATRGAESALEAYCVDPSAAFAPVADARFSLHMSGTLAPLEEYRDTLGMPPQTALMRVPSPFPEENLAVVYDPRYTTSHDVLGKEPGMLGQIATMASRLLASARVNTGVFFTSFAMKDKVLDAMRHPAGRPAFEEERGSTQAQLASLVERFKASDGGVLYAVMGGRIAEGLDFPGQEMEMALLVGVPFPKPTARSRGLVRFYDLKCGKGWEYAVRAPAARRLAQTVGRLIRNESDRGVAVLLDERGANFRDALPLRPDMTPERTVRTFFGARGPEPDT